MPSRPQRTQPEQPPPPEAPKARPRKLRPLNLKADPERFPELAKHPALERALLIKQAMEKGLTRELAIQAAEMTMGPRAPKMQHLRPGPGSTPRPRRTKAVKPQGTPPHQGHRL